MIKGGGVAAGGVILHLWGFSFVGCDSDALARSVKKVIKAQMDVLLETNVISNLPLGALSAEGSQHSSHMETKLYLAPCVLVQYDGMASLIKFFFFTFGPTEFCHCTVCV